MGILDRASRLISSNFNALLDQAEDPKKSLDQTLRQMKQQLGLGKTELVRAVAAERQLKSKLESLEADAARWETRAELAVRQGDDALARQALAQRTRVKAERDRTEALRATLRSNALEMKSAWEDMQRKFQDFNARKSTIVAQSQMARAGGGPEGLGAAAGVPTPFEEFRNIEDRIDGVDDVFDAQREVDQMLARDGSPAGLTSAELELRFRELEGTVDAGGDGSTAVEAELAEIKQRLRVRIE